MVRELFIQLFELNHIITPGISVCWYGMLISITQVKAEMSRLRMHNAIVPDGCTKYIQAAMECLF